MRRSFASWMCAGMSALVGMMIIATPEVGAMASIVHAAPGTGYLMAGADGAVYAYGSAQFDGSVYSYNAGAAQSYMGTTIAGIAQPVNLDPGSPGVANGYWLAGANGAVCNFGTVGALQVSTWMGTDGCYAAPSGISGTVVAIAGVTGLSSSPSNGYWLVTNTGGVYAYGGAQFYGSEGATPLTSGHYLAGIAVTPDGDGYWLVAQDGGVFAFGDAAFYGSMGATGLVTGHYAVGIAPTPDGDGYWLVAQDGGVFAFGDAAFYGSLGETTLPTTGEIVGITPSQYGSGYWLAGADGQLYGFGQAEYFGAQAGYLPSDGDGPIVGVTN